MEYLHLNLSWLFSVAVAGSVATGFIISNRTLVAADAQNRVILDSADDGIYRVDVNGIATYLNPAAVEMLGYSLEEVVGHGLHNLIHHSHPDGTPCPR